jgi:D-3-phosphoglycerate dehydrogenase
VAAQRGIEIIESHSSRPRDFSNLLSLKLHTTEGEHWIEGTVFEGGAPRVEMIDGVDIEAPLEGTLLVINNEDQPGVIGEVGTILGRHGINIGSFSLGRGGALTQSSGQALRPGSGQALRPGSGQALRPGSGQAVGVINLDARQQGDALEAAVKDLRGVAAIRRVCVIRLS